MPITTFASEAVPKKMFPPRCASIASMRSEVRPSCRKNTRFPSPQSGALRNSRTVSRGGMNFVSAELHKPDDKPTAKGDLLTWAAGSGSNEFVARSAYRHYEDPPTYQDHHIGFRVVSP